MVPLVLLLLGMPGASTKVSMAVVHVASFVSLSMGVTIVCSISRL